MIPRAGACSAREAVELEREPLDVVEPLLADELDRRVAVMFSSCPVCAFVAGVKIGSGSRVRLREPGRQPCPQTAPVAR